MLHAYFILAPERFSTKSALSCGSFEIGAQGADEVVGGAGLFVGGAPAPAKNVVANVALDHFGHERIHGPTARRDVVQYVGAFRLLVQRLLNRRHLSHDPADAIQQLLLLFKSVGHKRVFTSKNDCRKDFTNIPRLVYSVYGAVSLIPKISREKRPTLSDGGNSRLREQQIDTESAEPPSLTVSRL